MAHVIPLFALFFAASAVALFVSAPDPLTYYMHTAAILLVAVPAYFFGLRRGKTVADRLPSA